MSEQEDQGQTSDPNVSLKHIAWLAILILVPLIIVGLIVPLLPSLKKPKAPVINQGIVLPSPLPTPTPSPTPEESTPKSTPSPTPKL